MIEPSERLQNTIRLIHKGFSYARSPYWLCFGGLWGIAQNGGVIPDGDLDICTYYGEDYERITKAFAALGYNRTRCMIDDTNPKNAVYCSFDHPKFIHFCLSFWFKHGENRYYCHDSGNEIKGVAVPSIGYHFRGMPASIVEGDHMFRMIEWPGIEQLYKIRAPRFPGAILDATYEDWAYQKQKYVISKKHPVKPEKMVSYHKGGAVSQYAVWVQSMAQWNDPRHVATQLENAKRKWMGMLKITKNK